MERGTIISGEQSAFLVYVYYIKVAPPMDFLYKK